MNAYIFGDLRLIAQLVQIYAYTYIHTYIHVYINANKLSILLELFGCEGTYIHTCIHICIYKCIHTYWPPQDWGGLSICSLFVILDKKTTCRQTIIDLLKILSRCECTHNCSIYVHTYTAYIYEWHIYLLISSRSCYSYLYIRTYMRVYISAYILIDLHIYIHTCVCT